MIEMELRRVLAEAIDRRAIAWATAQQAQDAYLRALDEPGEAAAVLFDELTEPETAAVAADLAVQRAAIAVVAIQATEPELRKRLAEFSAYTDTVSSKRAFGLPEQWCVAIYCLMADPHAPLTLTPEAVR